MDLYDACQEAYQDFVACKDPGFHNQKEFIDELIHFILEGVSMRDPLFKELYRDVTFTGSSYEGLKIDLPDEYDININLCLPMMPSLKVYSDPRPQFGGFVMIENFNAALESVLLMNHDVYQKMVSWGDADGNLIPDRVRNWFQGLVHSYVIEKRQLLHGKFKLKFVHLKRSGPATTLQIQLANGFDIDIDLVTVLVFDNVNPPPPFRPLPENSPMTWSAVPKTKPRPRYKVRKWNRSYGSGPPQPPQHRQATAGHKFKKQNTEGIHWRLSFWRVEKQMMKNRQRMKPAIKMIKDSYQLKIQMRNHKKSLEISRLRDVRKWCSLSSYFIKTVALYELNRHEWNTLRLDEAFMILLQNLQYRMEKNCLYFYWDERCNLLQGRMKSIERMDIARRLSRDLKRFEANPVEVINVLGSEV